MSIAIAQKAKADKSLNVLINSEYGIVTKREFIQKAKRQGATALQSTKNRMQYSRTKYNRMWSTAEQDEYVKKCDEKVVCYNLTFKDESFYHITKTEFDYFNSL